MKQIDLNRAHTPIRGTVYVPKSLGYCGLALQGLACQDVCSVRHC